MEGIDATSVFRESVEGSIRFGHAFVEVSDDTQQQYELFKVRCEFRCSLVWKVNCLLGNPGSGAARRDLAPLLPMRLIQPQRPAQLAHPPVLDVWDSFAGLAKGKRIAVFSDYDGACRAFRHCAAPLLPHRARPLESVGSTVGLSPLCTRRLDWRRTCAVSGSYVMSLRLLCRFPFPGSHLSPLCALLSARSHLASPAFAICSSSPPSASLLQARSRQLWTSLTRLSCRRRCARCARSPPQKAF